MGEVEKEDPVRARLMRLKAFTAISGVLHEDQVRQLKMWPYVLDSQVVRNSIVIKIDQPTDPDGRITKRVLCFDWETTKSWLLKSEKKVLFDTLSEWVGTLLGKEWLPELSLEVKRVGAARVFGVLRLGKRDGDSKNT